MSKLLCFCLQCKDKRNSPSRHSNYQPTGYEYIKKFYLSCTSISDGFTTEEVFADCIKDDGKCTEREVEEYGNIYVQFLRYTEDFFKMTLFPAVNPNWENDSKDWFEGFGWTWWDVSANVLKDNFFLAAFHDEKSDKFRFLCSPYQQARL